jgi:type IV pilus assembly protein PilQ
MCTSLNSYSWGRMAASALVLLAGLFLGTPVADAGGAKGEILDLKSSTSKATTTLRIQGSSTPTFTVYKLENPSRVVVDVVGTTLNSKLIRNESKVVWDINSWAVGQVSAHTISKSRGNVVRVVVGLSRDSRYSVRASGKDVLVEVTAKTAPPVGGMDSAALKRAQAANASASKAAALELAQARAETQKIREQAALRDREAAAAIARAEAMMTEAKTRSAQAEKASQLAKSEIAAAEKRQASARSAEASAEKSKAALEKAEQAALAATSKANQARARNASNSNKLTARAEAATRAAEQRRKQSEKALQLAEKQRIASESATREADAQRIAAAKALELAQAERKRAEARRDQAIASGGAATSKRESAEKAAQEAAKRARELQDLVRAEEARFAEARSLRTQEESATAKARNARVSAEKSRSTAVAAQAKLTAEIARLSKAKRDAKQSRLIAEKALAKSEKAAADSKVSRTERDRLAQEAKSLGQARQAAEAALAKQERNISARRSQVTALNEKREAALKGLTALESKADLARSRRQAEEKQLVALSGKRAKMQDQLDEAKSMRIAAKAELDQARETRKQADALRLAAETQRLAAESQRREADALRLAAETQRLAAESQRKQAADQNRLATNNRREAELARNAAAKSQSEAESERKEAAELTRAAEQARSRAVAAESQVQRELELAKRARLAAETARETSALGIEEAKRQEVAAARRLKDRQNAREIAQNSRRASAAAIAKSKSLEAAAKDALAAAKAERLLAESARAKGEAALKLANQREMAAAKKLALANKAKPVVAKVRPSTRLSDLDVVQSQGMSRVVIAMSSPSKPRVVSNRGNEAVLEIPNAAIRNDQERTLDTSSLRGSVKAVSSYRDPKNPNNLKIVVDLAGASKGVLKKIGNTYYWEFPQTNAATAKIATKKPVQSTSYQTQAVAGYGSASSPITQQTVAQLKNRRRKTYRGQRIDLDYKKSDIHDLMRLLADVGGVNIIVPDDIKARVTIRLRRVPWDQALDVILASKGLGYKMEGPGLYRIATRKELDAEFEAKLARAKAMADSEAPKPEIFNLNYVDAKKIKKQLGPLLSPKGSLEVDDRNNALIINDVSRNRARIIDMLTRLDTQTPQIQIEARIVEARSTFIRQFGIQWGGNMNASAATGNATGLIFPSSIGLAGAAEDGQTPTAGVAASPSDFAVNLPAAIGTGSGGGIGLSLGSVGGALGLNLRLSALEDEGSVRIISSPKITTSNNIEAQIKSGVSIPISVISANGVQTQFVPADLQLKVKPSVSLRDCAVSMDIDVKKNEADFVNTGARGDPTLLTKEAKTTILVQDGDTSVIGGIYTRNSGVSYSKVPFFGDLPVFGWLFKTTTENDERTEVLIFITPKITNRAFLPCADK